MIPTTVSRRCADAPLRESCREAELSRCESGGMPVQGDEPERFQRLGLSFQVQDPK